MSTPTLDEILNPPDTKTVMDTITLPELRQARDGVKLPVSNWKPGGVFRSLAFGISRLYAEVAARVAAYAAGSFGDYAGGLVELPSGIDATGYATQWALDRAGVKRIDATRTTRTLLLTNALATARNVAAGGIVVKFRATGNRYVSAEAYSSAGSDAVEVLFQSEFTVDSSDPSRQYLDASSATIDLVTAVFPGVTVTNPAAAYSDVAQVGPGLGTITPSGTPDGTHSMAIRIDTAGTANTASGAFSYRVDGGAWVSFGILDDVNDLAGLNVNIAFAGAFLSGTVYYFSWPGTDVVSVGRDRETPAELIARARGVFPNMSFPLDANGNPLPTSPTMSGYEALLRSAFTDVKVCLVRTSETVNNKVHLVIAGQGALLDSGRIVVAQQFFDLRQMKTDRVEVSSPATTPINFGGAVVKVRQGQLAQAQATGQRAWAAYLGGVDAANRLGPGGADSGLIERAYLMALLRACPGVVHLDDGLTIEGVAADYQLADDTMATWSEQIASVLTWIPV